MIKQPIPSTEEGRAAADRAKIDKRLRQLERTTKNGIQWIPLSLSTKFENYGAGQLICHYSKDTNGIVRLQGLVKAKEAYTYGTVLATLPESFAPGLSAMFPTIFMDVSAYGLMRLDIEANGQIIPATTISGANTGTAGGWINLTGISYAASLE